jgi:hypothetical protein
MKSLVIAFIAIFTLSTVVFGQEIAVKPKNHCIGFVPQYSFIHGLRTDFDFRLKKNEASWLVVAPQFYLSSKDPNLYDNDSLWGVGIELQHRYYLNNVKTLPKGTYLGYGPMFQYFSISTDRLYSEKIIENGIEYYTVKRGVVNTGIYKFGMTLTAGYQALVLDVLYFDFYVGTGLRLSFDNRLPSGLTREYNNWWGNYGYSGTLLTFGMRVGMAY